MQMKGKRGVLAKRMPWLRLRSLACSDELVDSSSFIFLLVVVDCLYFFSLCCFPFFLPLSLASGGFFCFGASALFGVLVLVFGFLHHEMLFLLGKRFWVERASLRPRLEAR